LLVGYNWVTSNKIFERERQRLKEETLNETNAAVNKLGSELETKVHNAIVSMDDKSLVFKNELSILATSLNATIEQRTITFADDIAGRLETHRRGIDEALRAVSNKQLPEMETRINAVITKLAEKFEEDPDSNVKEVNNDLLNLTYRLYDNLGRQSGISKEWSQAFSWHLNALRAACQVGSEGGIIKSLDKIEFCVRNNGKPTKSEKNSFANFEKLVPVKLFEQYQKTNAIVQNAAEFTGPVEFA
jgi:hypothetical protein